MSYVCKTPVLLIFFNRPSTFKQVFEKVRKVEPKIVILAQDGARSEEDRTGIQACRVIAESIDWDCKVIQDYSDINLGCGLRPKSAIDNAFKKYEQIIILEDDCIPAISFFKYCEELLERYKDDERIAYISGLNHFERWDCGTYDYFFSKAGSIGAWATWRQRWVRFYDYYAKGIKDPYIRKLYYQQVGNKIAYENRIVLLEKAYQSEKTKEKLSYWDTQWGFAEYTQNMLAIIPKQNLIHNIGVGPLSTHAQKKKVNMWRKYKCIEFMPTHELDFPIKHPPFCACDIEYHQMVYKCFGGNLIKSVLHKILVFLGIR